MQLPGSARTKRSEPARTFVEIFEPRDRNVVELQEVDQSALCCHLVAIKHFHQLQTPGKQRGIQNRFFFYFIIIFTNNLSVTKTVFPARIKNTLEFPNASSIRLLGRMKTASSHRGAAAAAQCCPLAAGRGRGGFDSLHGFEKKNTFWGHLKKRRRRRRRHNGSMTEGNNFTSVLGKKTLK